jgi:large subunit ribosomal protein L13
MSTNIVKAKDIKRAWHLVDAEGKILGRLSTEIAGMLSGKTKQEYVPYLDLGDYVVVVNASKVKVTGKKEKTKEYVRHSGYPGGIKVETFEKLIQRRPEKIIEHAVKGMLPKNRLGAKMIKKLKVFPGSEHPYERQLGGNIG